MEFVAGIIAAVFVGFIVYKVRESKNKPRSSGGGSGGGPKDDLKVK